MSYCSVKMANGLATHVENRTPSPTLRTGCEMAKSQQTRARQVCQTVCGKFAVRSQAHTNHRDV